MRIGVGFGLAGVGGSLAGSALNRHLDPNLLLLGLAALIVVAAWRMLAGCPNITGDQDRSELPQTRPDDRSGAATLAVRRTTDAKAAGVVLVAGTGVGFVTGLFGVGGGFVILPALTLLLGLNMAEAIGTSLLVITINSTVALANRLAVTTIDWKVAGPFAVAAAAGVIAGKHLGGRLDSQRSLRWFAMLLVLVAVYTAARATTALVA
jgi:uncharacterized membrane protein YfcA